MFKKKTTRDRFVIPLKWKKNLGHRVSDVCVIASAARMVQTFHWEVPSGAMLARGLCVLTEPGGPWWMMVMSNKKLPVPHNLRALHGKIMKNPFPRFRRYLLLAGLVKKKKIHWLGISWPQLTIFQRGWNHQPVCEEQTISLKFP